MITISDIPVLYFPFARPEYARQTFDVIKKVKPKHFYFYCDKAREGNEEELKNNNIIRDYINEVDWDCDLKTWFRDENIGAYTSILNAIDWFFEHEEMGIILEEDCLSSLAFFDFCRQLLPKYEDDYRVWLITGNNPIEGYNPNGYDYIFTSAPSYIWGWATWRSRWQQIERNGFPINDIIEYKLNRQIYGSYVSGFISDWKMKQLPTDENGLWKPISWDYLFQNTRRVSGGLGIVPKVNLTTNIGVVGLNSISEDTFVQNKAIAKGTEFHSSSHPPFVISDVKYTTRFIKLNNKGFWMRFLKKKLKSILWSIKSV